MNIDLAAKRFILLVQAFWREKGFSGEVVSLGGKSPVPECEHGPVSITFDGVTSNGTPSLIGFIGGREAVQWNERTVCMFVIAFFYASRLSWPFRNYIYVN